MRRRWAVLIGSCLLMGACTASSTSADDATRADGPEGGLDEAAGDPELGALTRVSGPVDSAEVMGTLDGVATLPMVLTVPAGGGGNGAVITGIDAAGGDTIVWDGGRPLTLSGDGTVAVQPGSFRVRDGGLLVDLSGAAHALSPGQYSVAGPVAVGDGRGLAAPSTRTNFTAGDGSVLSGTGQVEGRLPPGTWLILGPGRVTLTGELRVQTSETTRTVASATMEGGSHEVTFRVHDDGSVAVEALLDGDIGV